MGLPTTRLQDTGDQFRAWLRRVAVAGVCIVLSGCGGGTPEPGQPIDADATLGGLGDTPGKFAFPRAIDAAADGRSLWVIDRSARVQRIDPQTGRCLAIWKMPDSELGKPVGFTVAPGMDAQGRWCDELLYIADTHYHRVMIYKPPPAPAAGVDLDFDTKPELVARFGGYGQGDGQFILPTDVAVLLGPDGRSVSRIYVGEYGGHDRISVFDGSYKFLFSFGSWGFDSAYQRIDPSQVVFARPQSLLIETIDGQPQLIVVDSSNHRIGRFTLDGQLLGWLGSPETMGDGPGQFRFPWGMASLADGTVMVTEFGGNRVQRIDLRTGQSLGMWGRAGRGEGELATPWAIAVLGKETFVVDSGNNRLLGFPTPRRRG
jgi:hypothetical protein